MINIIDYEMGNLRSVQKAFETLGFSARVSSDPADIASAEKVVLPGVGAFRDCIHNLREGGFVEPLRAHVAAGKPLLGICVGMQMLFDESEEFGRHQGLGLIPGKVLRFPSGMLEKGERLKVPHMGWNNIRIRRPAPIFNGIEDGSFVYFVHSYYCAAENAGDIAASCRYGEVEFCAALWRDNILATQFHPEKSQHVGLSIFKNFGEM
ncbi:imidazole glycerol phosphate synthase subunit HisH [Desulfuromonas versatilis]|uniref:Imidazole glycerol phosphate synthase subunit HisH n=1 Tax=Desulfuromonas versatilis TaxID=2802975 RepID=A0ABN6E2B2_9BACT|nr:imidazole glycerol phosphate synthase subunit HisH [Desulfuromonas versatilis]BCR06501.1 imidazole glycerol phosphate synthase subunit HisH [Desulfuromonas versatilis]